jgi:hypothetical protein
MSGATLPQRRAKSRGRPEGGANIGGVATGPTVADLQTVLKSVSSLSAAG